MVNALAFQFHREMLCLETMENICVSYAFTLPIISLLSGLFQTDPPLLFSGVPALVLSFVTLSFHRHLRFHGALDDKDRAARIFNNLMLQGKVHSALCYLSCHSSGGVLNLDTQLPVRSSNGDTD